MLGAPMITRQIMRQTVVRPFHRTRLQSSRDAALSVSRSCINPSPRRRPMPPPIQVNHSAHRAFGRLIRLTLDGDTRLDLTVEEAATVSRALTAVREGRSAER